MLVPLTDSTNPYAAMMLELIRIQQTRNRRETRRGRATVSRPRASVDSSLGSASVAPGPASSPA